MKTCQACCKESPLVVPCCYCGVEVCFECRREDLHHHDPGDPIRFGFCPPCGKVMELEIYAPGKLRCISCGWDWTPFCGHSRTNLKEVICTYCGALQISDAFPFRCGRCAMDVQHPSIGRLM